MKSLKSSTVSQFLKIPCVNTNYRRAKEKKSLAKGQVDRLVCELALFLRARSQSFLSNRRVLGVGNSLHSSSFLKAAPTFKCQAIPRKDLTSQ